MDELLRPRHVPRAPIALTRPHASSSVTKRPHITPTHHARPSRTPIAHPSPPPSPVKFARNWHFIKNIWEEILKRENYNADEEEKEQKGEGQKRAAVENQPIWLTGSQMRNDSHSNRRKQAYKGKPRQEKVTQRRNENHVHLTLYR